MSTSNWPASRPATSISITRARPARSRPQSSAVPRAPTRFTPIILKVGETIRPAPLKVEPTANVARARISTRRTGNLQLLAVRPAKLRIQPGYRWVAARQRQHAFGNIANCNAAGTGDPDALDVPYGAELDVHTRGFQRRVPVAGACGVTGRRVLFASPTASVSPPPGVAGCSTVWIFSQACILNCARDFQLRRPHPQLRLAAGHVHLCLADGGDAQILKNEGDTAAGHRHPCGATLYPRRGEGDGVQLSICSHPPDRSDSTAVSSAAAESGCTQRQLGNQRFLPSPISTSPLPSPPTVNCCETSNSALRLPSTLWPLTITVPFPSPPPNSPSLDRRCPGRRHRSLRFGRAC